MTTLKSLVTICGPGLTLDIVLRSHWRNLDSNVHICVLEKAPVISLSCLQYGEWVEVHKTEGDGEMLSVFTRRERQARWWQRCLGGTMIRRMQLSIKLEGEKAWAMEASCCEDRTCLPLSYNPKFWPWRQNFGRPITGIWVGNFAS